MQSENGKHATFLRWRAYSVHLYTASGLLWAFWAVDAIFANHYRTAFFLMTIAVIVDATDGYFARRWQVKKILPWVDGRKMDDIIDYLNYTFVPILLLWHAGWLPDPAWLWAVIPLTASVFGFCSTTAKEEEEGFFGGFPSYWNIVVFYVATWLHHYGPWVVVSLMIALSVLSVVPVRFVYPNLAPRWRPFFIWGGIGWGAILLALLIDYPQISAWIWYVSLIYPVTYTVLSIYLDRTMRP